MAAPRTETAIARIRDLIVAGELAPGSRLPPEHELAAQLGLSRNTAREAVRALVTARVLDVRRGDGTYVTSLSPGLLLEGIGSAVELMRDDGALEVLEVRRYLEPAATALAAGRIDQDGLRALAASIQRMREAADDEQFVAHDAEFHARVAEASGNGTLASLLAGLSSRTMRVRVLRAMSDAEALRRTIDQHEGIYAALAAGDPNLAQAMAVQHVITTEAWLRRLLAG
ncbi:MAG TPA: FadR/GntR family transcriptional regulator, partial [Actinomycetota bacterium]|nr:FadR/GntR family transcriptional regulator [Actinomycetota bacterium]